VPLGDKDRSYHGIFDLRIESLSDSSEKEVERDTVVKKFVSPFVREERIRTEQAEALLLRERAFSQRYAAQLRALGIAPETLE
jgi:hypothetical protein